MSDASELIDWLTRLPNRSVPASASTPPADPPSVGMYIAQDGTIVRVYHGQRSGRLLAKKVVGDKNSGYKYEYLGNASYWIRGSIRRMTLEEAKGWGRMSSTCCVCARRLDDPESVEAGIGPVCAKKV